VGHNAARSASRTRLAEPETNRLLQTLANLFTNPPATRGEPKVPAKRKRVARTATVTDTSAVAEKTKDAAPSTEDPFEALAAAVSAAAEAAEQTSANGEPKRGKRHGPPDDPLGKAIYSAAFGVGYGVALPTLLLIGMLPDNAVGRGLRDGARAARETVDRRRKR
jgi:hypothetical protein